ncbi:MAG TPA: shikimate dehydrogenase [Thermoplasmata archaeon]|nr:shikimate dehydrogenase [Thermoplasmata archaeon]
MTRVAAVIAARDGGEAERQARAALANGADLVELRLDHLRDLNPRVIRKLAAAVGDRSIATLRSPPQGGQGYGERSDRASQLKVICTEQFAYVDLECETDSQMADTLAEVVHRHHAEVIASQHFPEAVSLADVENAITRCAAIGDVSKVVVPVPDVESALGLATLARSEVTRKRRVVVIGTGSDGVLTRIVPGQEIQYASWGHATAPGQLPFATAMRLQRGKPILLGLLGHPISQSISPAIHEAALAAVGFPAVYLSFDIPPESVDALLRAADRVPLRGFNVTIPYKQTIIEQLDELDADAQRLGAVNTVVLEDGWAKGCNTDVHGFRLSLRSLGLRLGDRRVLVVGAGGAARAVVDVALQEGAHVEMVNRTTARADAVSKAFGNDVQVVEPGELPARGPWDLLVNATPVGANGSSGGLPVPESVVARSSFVYDLVYTPPATPLLQVAERLGRPGTSGLPMLLNQAARSFELWTGVPPPIEAMRHAAREAVR